MSEGETAASATSGITIEAVRAAAVSPVTAFSLREALTSNFPPDFDSQTVKFFLGGLTGSGFKKHPVSFRWADGAVNGIAIETAEVEAMCVCLSVRGMLSTPSSLQNSVEC